MPLVWIAGAGLALGAYGAYQGGKAQSAAADAQAAAANANSQAALFNADLADKNAAITAQQGEAARQTQQRTAERTIGTMVANYGASGVQSDNGSPMDVLADSLRMATLDSLTTQYNYALKAKNFTDQAALNRLNAANGAAAAGVYASAADTYSTSSIINTLGSGLTGTANLIKTYGMPGTPIPSFGTAGLNNFFFGNGTSGD